MGSLSVILRRPPYGTTDASEAVRHALGGITEDESVSLILLDGGVTAAQKGQQAESTEYLSVESGLIDCIDMGAEIYADRSSLEECGLKTGDLIEGIKVSNSREIAGVIGNSDTIMIF